MTNAFRKMVTTKAMLGIAKRLHQGQVKGIEDVKKIDPILHIPDKWTNKKGPKRVLIKNPTPNLR